MKLLVTSFLLSSAALSNGFVLPTASFQAKSTTTQLQMATVPPSSSATVGIVGRGFISVLTAKLAATAGYNTWMLNPPGQEETVPARFLLLAPHHYHRFLLLLLVTINWYSFSIT